MRGIALGFMVLAPALAGAQTFVQDRITLIQAEVVDVRAEEVRQIPGTHAEGMYQTIVARFLEGERAGETIELTNDYLRLRPGEVFYLRVFVHGSSGLLQQSVAEPYRIPALLWLAALFLLVLLSFGGLQGVRGLCALALSLLCIVYLLLPGILAGYPPVAVAMGVASLVVVVGSYLTHGLNRATSAAVIGMLITIGFTGALSYIAVHGVRLSGYAGEETVTLNFATAGSIDFVGLLLASLLIGLLGVLYDAAISQAVAVDELARAAAHYSKRDLFVRGLRIGREHIGALVNTLAIAYAGASLPLLLLLTTIPSQSMLITLN